MSANVLGQVPKPEMTAEEKAAKAEAIEKVFQKFLSEGKIAVDHAMSEDLDSEGKPKFVEKYVVARFTLDKEEAVGIVERLEMIHLFDRIKQICFVNGMVDGITQYLKGIRALNKPLQMERAVKIGQGLLDYIVKERVKI